MVFIHGAPPVTIDLWTEAKCPDCQRTIRNTVNSVLQIEGIWDIVDLTQTPWGNAYCETTACPSKSPGKYDADIRKCWDSKCTGNSPPNDCFSCIKDMSMTCQHGPDEAVGNRLIGCAIKTTVTKNSWWNFTLCFEGQHNGNLSYVKECATYAGYDYHRLDECIHGSLGQDIDLANAKRTCTHPHPGTPTIWIDNEQPNPFPTSPSQFLKLICAAYTGTKPAACK